MLLWIISSIAPPSSGRERYSCQTYWSVRDGKREKGDERKILIGKVKFWF